MILRTNQMMIYNEILFSRSIDFFFIFQNTIRNVHISFQLWFRFGPWVHTHFWHSKIHFQHMIGIQCQHSPHRQAYSHSSGPPLLIRNSRYLKRQNVFSYFVQNIFKTYSYAEAWPLPRKATQKGTKWFSTCFSLKLCI